MSHILHVFHALDFDFISSDFVLCLRPATSNQHYRKIQSPSKTKDFV